MPDWLDPATLWAAAQTPKGAVCILIGMVLGALALPPKYDPAFRLKEWLERRAGR